MAENGCGYVLAMFGLFAVGFAVVLISTVTAVDGYGIGDYPIKEVICETQTDLDYELPSSLIKDCMKMTSGEQREYWKEMYMFSCGRNC